MGFKTGDGICIPCILSFPRSMSALKCPSAMGRFLFPVRFDLRFDPVGFPSSWRNMGFSYPGDGVDFPPAAMECCRRRKRRVTRKVRSTTLSTFPLGGTASPYLTGCTSYTALESSISAKYAVTSSTRVGGALS